MDMNNKIVDFYKDISEILPWLIKLKMLLKPKKLLISGLEVKY
jgi:hypothetical protein